MSKIEWTEKTWNPIIGCSKISPGCQNCYAERMAGRLANIETTKHYCGVLNWENGYCGNEFESPGKYVSEGWNGKTHFVDSALEKPLKRKKPTMYFVCSMGDLFHESVPFEWILHVYEIMSKCPQHTFQVLTKRPERAKAFSDWLLEGSRFEYTKLSFWPLSNVWLGVTAENQQQADKRIPVLLEIPAAICFVSIEPMLSKVDLTHINEGIGLDYNALDGSAISLGEKYLDGDKLDWVICGGESGPNARPMNSNWVRSLHDQCKEANVPFFFKQWGEWVDELNDVFNDFDAIDMNRLPHDDSFVEIVNGESDYKGLYMLKIGKKKAGSLLDGVEYKEYPK